MTNPIAKSSKPKMSKKNRTITVQGAKITVTSINDSDYISLTDMVKGFGGEQSMYRWIRTRNTLEFLGSWEALNNPDFKPTELGRFLFEAGSTTFSMSPKKWIEATDAIGIISKSGRYGGTFAHEDIALEFGTYLSPQFKLYLITEFKRLKEKEQNEYNLEWSVRRVIASMNYSLHTDAIKNHIIPKSSFEKDREWIVYANEADLINVAVFGCTAKEWKEVNPALALENPKTNMRSYASINELAVLSNLESMSSEMIREGIDRHERFRKMKTVAKYQLEVLNEKDYMKSIKRIASDTFLNPPKELGGSTTDA